MKHKIMMLMSVLVIVSPVIAGAEIKTEEITYASDGITLNGFLAHDAGTTDKRPGILVVHEWWGHNDYVRKRAKMLAELGYTALAVDMYGDGKVAAHPGDAKKFATETMSNMETARNRFEAALAILKSQPTVDPDKIAAIGYCFGGGVVLHMARQGVDLDGVVSFHGSLGSPAPTQPGQVKAKVLVCTGAEDKMVPAEQVAAFEKEMADAGVDATVISYEGALHSFTNPGADEVAKKFGIPIGYNKAADQKSWSDMQSFLNTIF